MEKCFIQQEKMSFMYVIETSNRDLLLESCHSLNFCGGPIAVLPDTVCKSFKHKLSSTAGLSDDILETAETIWEDFELVPSWRESFLVKSGFESQLKNSADVVLPVNNSPIHLL
uniref:AlNc14C201G8683 protein n=1 Tax=Albugo laibachii Nc14 TaxID=890382 RepID=F0WQL6_9STRA|nr:AlNc14C201G8683 [Albugo laibachii Nc14]|eukprot:CCA23625.1 AlNc14C201G8683 [Albugo laibachii Nc14]